MAKDYKHIVLVDPALRPDHYAEILDEKILIYWMTDLSEEGINKALEYCDELSITAYETGVGFDVIIAVANYNDLDGMMVSRLIHDFDKAGALFTKSNGLPEELWLTNYDNNIELNAQMNVAHRAGRHDLIEKLSERHDEVINRKPDNQNLTMKYWEIVLGTLLVCILMPIFGLLQMIWPDPYITNLSKKKTAS